VNAFPSVICSGYFFALFSQTDIGVLLIDDVQFRINHIRDATHFASYVCKKRRSNSQIKKFSKVSLGETFGFYHTTIERERRWKQ
jgi:hypothetical protein